MKYFLCLDEVRIGDAMKMGADGVYHYPYTGEDFHADDKACPCWPRLPMGWNWSVFLAVELAEHSLQRSQQRAAEKDQLQTTPLNIPKKAFS